MNLLQSIHLAKAAGPGLHFPDGSTAYLGALSGIVLVRYPSGQTEQWHNEELYDAIKARLTETKPAQDWREKIIQLIKTAELFGPSNYLKNGDVEFFRSLDEDYVNVWREHAVNVTLYSPEFFEAVDARRAELLNARRRAKDDAQSEAIERILS